MKVDSSKIRGSGNNTVTGTESSKSQKIGGDAKKVDVGSEKKSVDAEYAKVAFSNKAQMAAKAKELATPDMNTVREDKVAYYQKLIDEGKYTTDSKAIADKIVDEHLIG